MYDTLDITPTPRHTHTTATFVPIEPPEVSIVRATSDSTLDELSLDRQSSVSGGDEVVSADR